jgi:AbrB family looped-hinge helix DNA binding protein
LIIKTRYAIFIKTSRNGFISVFADKSYIRYIQILRKSTFIGINKMAEYILKVGKKGEIYTPKKLRLRIGISPGNEIIATTKGNQLLLKKKKTIIELLEDETIASVTEQELKNERRLLEKKLLEG